MGSGEMSSGKGVDEGLGEGSGTLGGASERRLVDGLLEDRVVRSVASGMRVRTPGRLPGGGGVGGVTEGSSSGMFSSSGA